MWRNEVTLRLAFSELVGQVENPIDHQAEPQINQDAQVKSHRLVTGGGGKVGGQREVKDVSEQNGN